MGLIDRVNLLVRSNLSFSSKDTPRDGPRGSLADLEETLREARKRMSSVLRDERQLEAEIEGSRREEDLWEKRAVVALRKGDEDAARDALAQRNRAGARTERTLERLREHRSYIADLMNGLEALEAKLDGVRTRQPASSRRAAAEPAPSYRPAPKPAPIHPEPEPEPAPRRNRLLERDEDLQRWEATSSRRATPPSSPRRASFDARGGVDGALEELDASVSRFEEFEDKITALEADVAATWEMGEVIHDEDDPLYDPKMAELERRFRELEKKDRRG